ncbi:hypothetical protein HGRIS_010346 [Hohenbuehelia grisea]|uniref:Uncharacterized protein n=1 Tax=Hohenbuehelia grisea TaxID=104357 RepID=A0ABR3J423_9AGAR
MFHHLLSVTLSRLTRPGQPLAHLLNVCPQEPITKEQPSGCAKLGSQVDRSADAAYCSYALQTLHPRHILCHYFDPLNIHPFCQVQEATGMLISGSSALQLLDRTDYLASDLDLDVELPHGDLAVA